MNTYQKIAAFIFRLTALGIIIYASIQVVSLSFIMPAMIWALLPFLAVGIVLFLVSIPLAKIATVGFDQ